MEKKWIKLLILQGNWNFIKISVSIHQKVVLERFDVIFWKKNYVVVKERCYDIQRNETQFKDSMDIDVKYNYTWLNGLNCNNQQYVMLNVATLIVTLSPIMLSIFMLNVVNLSVILRM